ncbi:MAG: ImmA/IrrE family metallo-endopeptidase [Clostridia bacterium]
MYPCDIAQNLIEKYNSTDPILLCDFLDIYIIYCDLPENIQGFFNNFNDVFIIYINNSSNEDEIDCIIAHELGHIMMHSELNTLFLRANSYINVDKYEKEANIFSAYLNFSKFKHSNDFALLTDLLQIDFDTIGKIAKYKEKFR